PAPRPCKTGPATAALAGTAIPPRGMVLGTTYRLTPRATGNQVFRLTRLFGTSRCGFYPRPANRLKNASL
ncbi:hypothetical protein CDO43_34325, partial [Pseudomonas aeruginosa]